MSFQKSSKRRNKLILLFAIIFHLSAAIFSVYLLKYGDMISQGISDERAFEDNDLYVFKNNSWKFFTTWNVVFQTTFLSLSFLYDILEWRDKHENSFGRSLKYWRDLIFSSVALPITMFVVLTFWIVFWVDRELVFPTVYDEVVPTWFNHCVHTNIGVVLLLETLVQPRRRPVNEKVEVGVCMFIVALYAVVYYSIYFLTDRWLYKVFGVMSWWQVCLYQVFVFLSAYVYYKLQFPVNRFVHGDGSSEIKITPQIQKSIDVVSTKTTETSPTKKLINNGLKINIKENVYGNGFKSEIQGPPFSDKTWNLKYRSLKGQFENTRL